MLNIIYSDSSNAVAEKPAGMLSVPGRGAGRQDSAAGRVRRLFPGCIDQPSVHRLDMDTSGLLVFALTKEAHRSLSIQFQQSIVKKKYTAVLEGLLDRRLGSVGRIELSFRLDPANRPYQVYDAVQGKKGISLWRKLLENEHERLTRVEFTPLTGRTHQLRLHAAHPADFCASDAACDSGSAAPDRTQSSTAAVNHGGLGCPIAGDRLYGSSSDAAHESGERMLLHASWIEFRHPETGRLLTFSSPPPF